MTVAELLSRISSQELSEWMAYEKHAGPLGAARGDIQAGIIAATIANANRSKKSSKVHKPSAFIPTWDKPEQTDDDMLAMVVQLNRQFGGEDRRGKHSQ